MFIIIETKQGTSYQLECPIDLDADEVADVFVSDEDLADDVTKH